MARPPDFKDSFITSIAKTLTPGISALVRSVDPQLEVIVVPLDFGNMIQIKVRDKTNGYVMATSISKELIVDDQYKRISDEARLCCERLLRHRITIPVDEIRSELSEKPDVIDDMSGMSNYVHKQYGASIKISGKIEA